MPGGVYSALSGMLTRLDELDRIAADLANVSTAGYKTERTDAYVAGRTEFADALESAVDVVPGFSRLDLRAGTLASTGRPLDVAIEGKAMFVVETESGLRYTRNGALNRRADGTLINSQGDIVLGEPGGDNGGQPIKLGAGEAAIDPDGTVRSGGVAVGKLRLVEFSGPSDLLRDSGARFRAIPGATPTASTSSSVISGSIEQSNASVVNLMTSLTDVTRSFESLQRGVSILNNDLDARAISELGRR